MFIRIKRNHIDRKQIQIKQHKTHNPHQWNRQILSGNSKHLSY